MTMTGDSMFKIGDRASHWTFGKGTVQDVTANSATLKLDHPWDEHDEGAVTDDHSVFTTASDHGFTPGDRVRLDKPNAIWFAATVTKTDLHNDYDIEIVADGERISRKVDPADLVRLTPEEDRDALESDRDNWRRRARKAENALKGQSND